LPVLNFFLFYDKDRIIKRLQYIITNFLIAGASTIVLALACQGPLIRKIIGTNYSELYSAYQRGFVRSLDYLVHEVGLIIMPFFMLGIVAACITKNTKAKIFIAFCVFNLLFSFSFFCMTQSPAMQHIVPFALWILFVAAFGIQYLTGILRSRYLKRMLSLIIVFLSAVSMINAYLPGFRISTVVDYWLPLKSRPFHFKHYDNYVAMVSRLETLTRNGKNLSIIASNGVLNDDMLDTLSDHKLLIYCAPQVDLRDGIRLSVFTVDYIVVTDPTCTHLAAKDQQVITIPAEYVKSGKGIGRAYKRLPESYVTAYIYERVSGYDYADAKEFMNRFYVSYPSWREKYKSPLFISYLTSKFNLGDKCGEFKVNNDCSMYMRAGESKQTSVSMVFSDFSTLLVKASSDVSDNADGVDLKFMKGNSEIGNYYIKSGEEVKIPIKSFSGQRIELILSRHTPTSHGGISMIAEELSQ
jgi:hypothetical protein